MKHYSYMKEEDGWAILNPDGARTDWPLLPTEEEAELDVKEFNNLLRDDSESRNKAIWLARMAGDLDI